MYEPELIREKTSKDESLNQFNRKIMLCRDMISNKQLSDAKNTYNDLKKMFSNTSLSPNQKEILYNSLRELYDDIYLGLLD